MGFLDNLVKSIESGTLQQTLIKAVDGLEEKVNKVVETVDEATAKLDKPANNTTHDTKEPQQT